LQEGTVVTCTLKAKNEDIVVKETYLSRDTWMGILKAAGFTKAVWFAPEVASEGIALFGEKFWVDYIELPATIFLQRLKNNRMVKFNLL
jgi:toxoflavin synthase